MLNKTFRIVTVWMLILIAGILFCRSALARDRHIKVSSINDYGYDMELDLPSFEIEDIDVGDNKYQRIRLQEWAMTSRVGFPELPVKGILIQSPRSGKIVIDVIESAYKLIPNCQIYPVPKNILTDNEQVITEFIKDEEGYNSQGFSPEALTEVDSRGIFRGVSVARVRIYPFQWNPATKELRYYTKLKFNIRFEESLPPETIGRFGREMIFNKMAEKTIINYKGREKIRLKQSSNLGESSGISKEFLRIEIKEDGIYRVTYDDLVNAGVKPRQIDPTTYQLFNQGNEVAIKVVPKRKRRGRFTPGSFIEFYGQGVDNLFTDTNVYWLQWEEAKGKRVSQVDGAVTGDGKAIDSFFERLHFEENHTLWQQTPGAEEQDYWFWEKLTAPVTGEHSINVPSPAPGLKFDLRVAFQGRSTEPISPNHNTTIFINDFNLGSNFWDGDSEFIQESAFISDFILDGANIVKVELPGDTGANVDVVFINWIEVDYWRFLEAEQDSLTFTINDNRKLQIGVNNFSSRDIMIYDISNPLEVKEIVNFSIETDERGNKVIFDDQISGEKTYYVLTTGQIRKPEGITLQQPSDLKSSANGADYIVVTANEFIPKINPLLKLRQDQGLRVKAVSVEDIFNEFNFGMFDPVAIKDFLQFAFENWEEPSPTYVMFVGDANTDYRDFLETGKENIAPVHHSITTELGVTPDDTWYVSVAGDDLLPDMLVGRIPGNSPDMVAQVINKLVSFEETSNSRPESVLFVADEDSEDTFEKLNNELAEILTPEFSNDKVNLREFEDVKDATQDIISKIDDGQLITNYVGHGAVINWSRKNMFKSEHVASLNNNDLTFVITLNCLNGFFAQPSFYSLAEEFVIAQNKGTIAAFSSSTLGFTWEHNILNKQVFSSIFEDGNNVLGLITTQSKIDAFARGITSDTMISFTLFGDPAGKLKTGE